MKNKFDTKIFFEPSPQSKSPNQIVCKFCGKKFYPELHDNICPRCYKNNNYIQGLEK